MIGNFLWLTARSLKNRLLHQLRRLKKPRYLISALVGMAYIWMVFLRNAVREHEMRTFGLTAEIGALLFTILLFGALLLPWALPTSVAGLQFSEAEIQFLFPAPVSRRQLLLYKVIRSQLQLLFSTVLFGLLIFRHSNLVGIWFTFNALNVYFMMVSFGRARLRQAGIGWLPRIGMVLAVLAGTVALVVSRFGPAVRTVLLGLLQKQQLGAATKVVTDAISWAPLHAILFVPSMLARPLSARTPIELAISLLPALSLAVVSFFIMVRLDYSFEETSVDLSKKKAARIEQARGGLAALDGKVTFRRMPKPFTLGALGPPELAIFWKNLIAAGRVYSVRLLLILGIPFIFVVLNVFGGIGGAYDTMMSVIGILAFPFGFLYLFMGPLMLRNDLRADRERIETLKSYPLAGWRLVAAEVAAPTAIISAMAILFLALGFASVHDFLNFSAGQFVSGAVAAVLLIVGLVSLQVIIHNAIVIILPGWSRSDQSRGFITMGQNLVLMIGQLFTLGIALIPAALVIGIGAFIASSVGALGVQPIAVAAIPAAMLLWFEAWAAVHFLGAQFEKIDIGTDLDVPL
ncbi:MAG: putative ABC exporter domain-containing protein [Thermoanaerobaculia bacterium]